MDRRNTQRFIERMRSRGKAGNSSAPASTKNRKYGKWAGWTILTIVALLLCSVAYNASRGGRFESASNTSGIAAMPTNIPAPQDQIGEKYALDANTTTTGAFTTSDPGNSPPGAQPAIGSGSSQSQAQTRPWDRMIVRTATLQLTVKDVAQSVDKVRLLAALHGGYVFQSDSHQDGDYTVASITVQVPSAEFDKVMPELRKLDGQVKKIVQENVTSSDVTEEYTDLQSQLRNLQATEARMLALQQKAEKLEDILALDQQLRQIQGQIEQIQGRLSFLSKRSDMSSITVGLAPDKPLPEPTPEPLTTGWQPGEIALTAWNASLDMLSGIATLVITVAVFMWWTTPLILLGLWLALRSRRRPTTGQEPTPPTPPSSPAGEPSVL